MITIRRPDTIYDAEGPIEEGTFHGRWHFSFGEYRSTAFEHFGVLRVFNDDTISPGATWPLHPHKNIEVVTYCAGGEFRHADERGKGGVLKKGDVQHTTVGSGMWHSEINNRKDSPMRFIQMWFYPAEKGLKPSMEQRHVEREERTDRLLPLVSPVDKGALPIHSDARVFSSFLEKGKALEYKLASGRGAYIYVLEGGPLNVNGKDVSALGAVMARQEPEIRIKAGEDTELLLVDVGLV